MAKTWQRLKRRIGRLLTPTMWKVGLTSLCTVIRLIGLRNSTPLDQVAGPWEKERGSKARTGAPLPGDISVPRFLAGLPIFIYPIFPKPCLRRSLVVYRHLVRLGLDPELWIGIKKNQEDLTGHAWIMLEGRVRGEPPWNVVPYAPILILRRGKTAPPKEGPVKRACSDQKDPVCLDQCQDSRQ